MVSTLAITMVFLIGCAPGNTFVPTPPVTIEPIFSTDEEALEAVVAHYQEYLAVSDAVYADGGANPERLQPYVSAERYAFENQGATEFAERGFRTFGNTDIYNWNLQSLRSSQDGSEVVFYVCVDVSNVDLYDAQNNLLPEADVSFPYVVNYEILRVDGSILFSLVGDEIWESNYPC